MSDDGSRDEAPAPVEMDEVAAVGGGDTSSSDAAAAKKKKKKIKSPRSETPPPAADAAPVYDDDDTWYRNNDEEEGDHNLLAILELPVLFFRGIFRVLVLFALLGLCAAAIYFIVDDRLEVQEVTGTLPADAAWVLNIDGCEVVITHATAPTPSSYTVRTQVHEKITVTKQTNGFTVKNEKFIYERYTDYFCEVAITTGPSIPVSVSIIDSGFFPSVVRANDRGEVQMGEGASLVLRTVQKQSATSNGGSLSFIASSFGGEELDVDVSRGTIQVDRIRASTDVLLKAEQGSAVFLGTLEPVRFHFKGITTSACVVTFDKQPDAQVTAPMMEPGWTYETLGYSNLTNDGNPTTWPLYRIESTGYVSVHAVSPLTPVEDYAPIAVGAANAKLEVNKVDLDRISRIMREEKPEVIEFYLSGRGLPPGRWTYHVKPIFTVFSHVYLHFSTVTLLSPRTVSVNLTLAPSFCPSPLLSADGKDDLMLSTVMPIYNLLHDATGSDAEDEDTRKQEDEERSHRRILFAPDSLPEHALELRQDEISGNFFLFEPTIQRERTLIALVAASLMLAFVGATLTEYLCFSSLARWRREKVDQWAAAVYEKDEYAEKRDELQEAAGPFFMLEFIVAPPHLQRSFFQSFRTVLVHLSFIIVTVLPVFAATLLYHHSEANIHNNPTPELAIILYLVCAGYIGASCLYLSVYYIGVPWKYRRVLGWPWYVLLAIVSYCSVSYTIYATSWLLLGALVQPEQILPFAACALVLLAHIVATVLRVRRLQQSLDENMFKHKQEIETSPSHVRVKGSLTVEDSFKYLSAMHTVEIAELAVRNQIVKEIGLLIALIVFFIFVLFGFLAFGSTNSLSAATSTVLVVIAGGGVNLPLRVDPKEAMQDMDEAVVHDAEEKARFNKKRI